MTDKTKPFDGYDPKHVPSVATGSASGEPTKPEEALAMTLDCGCKVLDRYIKDPCKAHDGSPPMETVTTTGDPGAPSKEGSSQMNDGIDWGLTGGRCPNCGEGGPANCAFCGHKAPSGKPRFLQGSYCDGLLRCMTCGFRQRGHREAEKEGAGAKDSCEGCGQPATREDSVGVPLCAPCYREAKDSGAGAVDNIAVLRKMTKEIVTDPYWSARMETHLDDLSRRLAEAERERDIYKQQVDTCNAYATAVALEKAERERDLMATANLQSENVAKTERTLRLDAEREVARLRGLLEETEKVVMHPETDWRAIRRQFDENRAAAEGKDPEAAPRRKDAKER